MVILYNQPLYWKAILPIQMDLDGERGNDESGTDERGTDKHIDEYITSSEEEPGEDIYAYLGEPVVGCGAIDSITQDVIDCANLDHSESDGDDADSDLDITLLNTVRVCFLLFNITSIFLFSLVYTC